MARVVVGLDLSLTSTGLVAGVPSVGLTTREFRIRPGKRTDPARMLWIRDEILAELGDGGPLIVLEGFAYGAKGSAVFQVAGLGWIVRAALHEHGYEYVTVAPSALKTFATGKGSGGKDAVVSAVTHRTGREFTSNDVVDAMVCYSIGCELLGHRSPMGVLPASHLRALAKLDPSETGPLAPPGAV